MQAEVFRGEYHDVCNALLNGLVKGKCVCVCSRGYLYRERWRQCGKMLTAGESR